MIYPLGFDLGSHLVHDCEDLNWDNLVQLDWPHGLAGERPHFAMIRAHRGAWPDPCFDHFRAEAERLGLPWGAWHVLRREEDARAQALTWAQRPAGPMGRWVDYEPYGPDRTIPTGTQLLTAWDVCEQADGRPCGTYSRYMIVNGFLNAITTDQLNARPWWLAQYLFGQQLRGEFPPESLTTPDRVQRDKVLILQTADRLAPPGGRDTLPDASAIDRNRWVGTMTLQDYLTGWDPPLTLEARVGRLEEEAAAHGWDL